MRTRYKLWSMCSKFASIYKRERMKVAIGSDHAGFRLKEKLKAHLQSKGFEVKDFGTYSEERADYPDFAHPVADAVGGSIVDFGVLICGSGNGVNMTANS